MPSVFDDMERNTMAYTLTEAATATGLSRSTIFRAIKSGRISATRIEGNFSIEPAELHRVFPPASEKHADVGAMTQDATATVAADTVQIAELEAEIRTLRGMSSMLRETLHETRTDRDAWRQQAQQLALPKRPEPSFGSPVQRAPHPRRPRWWWKRSA
jgi:excisionase family DNA binding protein